MNPPAGLRAALMSQVRDEAGRAHGATGRSRFALRVPSLSRVRPAMAWVSAAFLLAVGVVAGVGANEFLGGNDGGQKTLAAKVDSSRVPTGSASLLVPDGGDGAILSVHGLDQAVGRQVYVVWVERSGERIFESSFNVRPDGSGKAAIEDLSGVDRVMVTRERSADVSHPTEDPIISVSTS